MENKNIISEKYIEKILAKETKKLGFLCIKLLPFEFKGLPDRMILGSGQAFFAEIKTTGKKVTPIQKLVHKMFSKAGFHVWVIDTIELKDEFIEHIKNATRKELT